MLSQFESLPTDSPAPMILFWVIAFVICYVLIDTKRMNRRTGIIIYLITVFLAGILLGGIPNVVLPIEYTLTTIGERNLPHHTGAARPGDFHLSD